MPPGKIVDGDYTAFWSDEDEAWVGVCTQYAHVSHVGAPDGPSAIAGIKAVKAEVDQILRESEAESKLDP